MRQVTTVVPIEDRLKTAKTRLFELTGGDAVSPETRELRLSRLRDGDINADMPSRLLSAYLVKLVASLTARARAHVYVEVVIAGRPEDTKRRVFARITDTPEHDGTVLDIYTKSRDTRFEPVPVFVPLSVPSKRTRKTSKEQS